MPESQAPPTLTPAYAGQLAYNDADAVYVAEGTPLAWEESDRRRLPWIPAPSIPARAR